MDTRDNTGHYDLYEVEGYDPLDDIHREQGFRDEFWMFSDTTLQDLCDLANPLLHP